MKSGAVSKGKSFTFVFPFILYIFLSVGSFRLFKGASFTCQANYSGPYKQQKNNNNKECVQKQQLALNIWEWETKGKYD